VSSILDSGLALVLAFQSLGTWLVLPMKAFTFLGTEEFFFAVLPAIYWCVDSNLGLRIGVILLFNGAFNDILKLAFHGPRPYWYSPLVKAFTSETSFGVPSGHAQNAAGVWGIMASRLRRGWVWAAAVVLIFLIGLSRIYLGVHFPHDVLLGWLFGGLVLWAFVVCWDRASAWLKKISPSDQVLVAFGVSMALIALGAGSILAWGQWTMPQIWLQNAAAAVPDGKPPTPLTLNGTIAPSGTLFGLAMGLVWLETHGGVDVSGPVTKRFLRYVLGLLGILIFWYGLGLILPQGESILPMVLRYFRYALVGAWLSGGAPELFVRLRLANRTVSAAGRTLQF
jgi:membrane-associated phospholipid phosphatase